MHDLDHDVRGRKVWREGQTIGDLLGVETDHEFLRPRVGALEQSLPLAALEIERFGSCGSQATRVPEDHPASIPRRRRLVTVRLTATTSGDRVQEPARPGRRALRTTGLVGLRRATSLNPARSYIDFAPKNMSSGCFRSRASTG